MADMAIVYKVNSGIAVEMRMAMNKSCFENLMKQTPQTLQQKDK